MNQFATNVITKIKDYFTANQGRKIFFYGLVTALISLILYFITHFGALYMLLILGFAIAGVGSLWDTMLTRVEFLKRVRDLQYEHLKSITDKQNAGEDIPLTPTFTDEEERYIRRRKRGFVGVILFKVLLIIALISLLSVF